VAYVCGKIRNTAVRIVCNPAEIILGTFWIQGTDSSSVATTHICLVSVHNAWGTQITLVTALTALPADEDSEKTQCDCTTEVPTWGWESSQSGLLIPEGCLIGIQGRIDIACGDNGLNWRNFTPQLCSCSFLWEISCCPDIFSVRNIVLSWYLLCEKYRALLISSLLRCPFSYYASLLSRMYLFIYSWLSIAQIV
jgi:hypothetical protein